MPAPLPVLPVVEPVVPVVPPPGLLRSTDPLPPPHATSPQAARPTAAATIELRMLSSSPPSTITPEPTVTRVAELPLTALADLLLPHGLTLVWLAPGSAIPGSYWGESEAGLIGDNLYL